MVKVNYFFQGFVGKMQTKEFENRDKAREFLKENDDKINVLTASIEEV